MAITKTTEEDKIEIIGEGKDIQVRTATVIKEDGVELTRTFHRHTISCVSTVKNEDDSFTHTDTDISGESTEIQAIANAVWTDAIKEIKKAANESSEI
jgi:hypothetical protein|tara:strand:+ start:1093 stop:1386 length:294 start_codon:yes stop_codon:yes gene_type:complete